MIKLNGTNTFTALYTLFQQSVLNPVQAITSDVLAAAGLPLQILMIIMLMVIGIAVLLGRANPPGVVNRLIRMAIVVSVIAGSGIYFHYVQSFFLTGLPDWLNKHIVSLATGASGVSQSSPGTGFDYAMNLILHDAKKVTQAAPTGLDGIVPGLEVVFCEAVAVICLGFLFAVFIIVQTLLGIVIIIGPLMILGYLFDYTKRFTDGWISALITLSLLSLVIDIVVLILVNVVSEIFGNLSFTGNFALDLQTLVGGAAGIVVIALAVAVLPRVIEAIGGGIAVGIGLENSSRWLRGSSLFLPNSSGQASRQSRSSNPGQNSTGQASRQSRNGNNGWNSTVTSRIVNRIRNRNRSDS